MRRHGSSDQYSQLLQAIMALQQSQAAVQVTVIVWIWDRSIMRTFLFAQINNMRAVRADNCLSGTTVEAGKRSFSVLSRNSDFRQRDGEDALSANVAVSPSIHWFNSLECYQRRLL